MMRSGSTWSYEMVRRLMSRESPGLAGGSVEAIGQALAEHGEHYDDLVLKAPQIDAVGRALVKHRLVRTVMTYREPLDAILSGVEALRLPFDAMVGRIKAALTVLRFQADIGATRFVWYGDLTERPADTVTALAEHLCVMLPDGSAAELAGQLSRDAVRRIVQEQGKAPGKAGAQSWDSGTLFQAHHIRATPADPRTVFSAAQIATVVAKLREFVTDDAMLRDDLRGLGMLPAPAEPPADTIAPAIVTPEPVSSAAVEAAPAIAPEPATEEADAPDTLDTIAALDAAEPPPTEVPDAPTETAVDPEVAALAATKPGEKPAAPKKPIAWDPVTDARRQALARNLLRSLSQEMARTAARAADRRKS
jgi:hypothetical protein